MINLSKELRNRWLGDGINDSSLLQLLNGGVLALYGGSGISMPTAPELIETGTLLMLITLDGNNFVADQGEGSINGLEFVPSTTALLAKPGALTWRGTAVADGTPRYARLYDRNFITGPSDIAIRADLSVGLGSGAVRLSSLGAYVSGITMVYCTQLNLSLPDTII